jgi:hypothetical protein
VKSTIITMTIIILVWAELPAEGSEQLPDNSVIRCFVLVGDGIMESLRRRNSLHSQ